MSVTHREYWLAGIPAGAAVATGVLVAPLLTAVAVLVVSIVFFGFFMKSWTPVGVFLTCTALLLAGYALFGRGFAYLGISPVYVGEIVLAIGIALVLLGTRFSRSLQSPISWLVVLFAVWGAARTIPYIGEYGRDAFRDATLWGYAGFALLVSAAVSSLETVDRVPRLYFRFLLILLCWVPLSLVIGYVFADNLPLIPGTDHSIIERRPYYFAAHLAGAGSFLLIGTLTPKPNSKSVNPDSKGWLLWALWICGFVMAASQRRAAILAVALAMLSTFLFFPTKRWRLPALMFFVFVLAFQIVGPNLNIGRERAVSPSQVMTNLLNIVSDKEDKQDLGATKRWRSDWWSEIVNDTVFGDRFWVGRGYGVNLGDTSGFTPAYVGDTRSPHNAAMTILGRSGVPGLGIWVVLQFAFCYELIRSIFLAKRNRHLWWMGLFVWILSYWSAMMITSLVEVFLESPHGGIWFWCLFGYGIAMIARYRIEYSKKDGLFTCTIGNPSGR